VNVVIYTEREKRGKRRDEKGKGERERKEGERGFNGQV
jgi:hypothetical protein